MTLAVGGERWLPLLGHRAPLPVLLLRLPGQGEELGVRMSRTPGRAGLVGVEGDRGRKD